jgi:hypothetical protein
MYARERIIRDRFAERSCGRCGTQYTTDSVLILARRPSHWMVMASCHGCSQRNLYLISFSDIESDADTPASPGSLPPSDRPELPYDYPPAGASDLPFALPTSFPPPSIQPITDSDVAAMHDFLQDFSGDFRNLFSTPRPRWYRNDESST